MPDTQLMSLSTIADMDAITLIVNDHQAVELLFTAYERTSDPTMRMGIVAKICEELTVHATVEEQVFYPAVADRLEDGEEEAGHAEEEHDEAKELLSELEGMDPTSAEFDATVRELIADVRHHVEEEETDMLPKMRDAMSAEELRDLGLRLREAKATAPVSPSMEAEREIDLTRDELYEKAQELGIEGRSEMNKAELARAVEQGR